MAFKKTLVQRLFNLSRFSTPTLRQNPTQKPQLLDPNSTRTVIDSDNSSTRYQSTVAMRLFPPTSDTLAEALKGMDITKGRLNLDGLVTHPKYKAARVVHEQKWEVEEVGGLTVSEVRKVLRATQVEMITSKLRSVGKDWVTYEEFVGLIEEFCGGNREKIVEIAKMLDNSGCVILFGNFVCLRPHQVAKTLHNLVKPAVSVDPNDPRKEELEVLEEQKEEIDKKAEALVRRELWAGLGYMVVQTAAFMRLTFWELSWDVMEPICCYVTSAYFMFGYAFFLRTSKEPSFEGFFQSRFNAKQKRLMKAQEFDLKRYNELRIVFHPHCSSSALSLEDARLIKYDHYHKVN